MQKPNWSAPPWWETVSTLQPLPRLNELQLHTIVFVTDRQPSRAVALAVRHNPGVRVLVIAPQSQRMNVLALNANFADLNEHSNRTSGWDATFRQGSPGSRVYHLFCHLRWLAIGAELYARPLPATGAVAVLDDDVLLFEQVADRLRGAGAYHPMAHAEVVVSGAFLIGSSGAFMRLATFLWALYGLPAQAFSNVVYRYGEMKAVADLHPRDRARIDPAFRRGSQYARFSDMDAVEAFRSLSRSSTSTLPSHLAGVHWAAGYRRPNCTHVPKVEKLGIPLDRLAADLVVGAGTRLVGEASDKEDVAASSEHRTRRLVWRENVPRLQPSNEPLCFLHLQGPLAKSQLLTPMLRAAGIVDGFTPPQ